MEEMWECCEIKTVAGDWSRTQSTATTCFYPPTWNENYFRYSRKYLLLSTDLVLPLPDDVGGGLVSAVHAARQLQRGVVVHVYVGPAHDLRDGLCVDM